MCFVYIFHIDFYRFDRRICPLIVCHEFRFEAQAIQTDRKPKRCEIPIERAASVGLGSARPTAQDSRLNKPRGWRQRLSTSLRSEREAMENANTDGITYK